MKKRISGPRLGGHKMKKGKRTNAFTEAADQMKIKEEKRKTEELLKRMKNNHPEGDPNAEDKKPK